MTAQTNRPGGVPPLTLGWRLRMALEWAGLSVDQMTEALGVSRATISRWTHDKGAAPRPIYLNAWALATGVPVEWLRTGDTASPDANRGYRPPLLTLVATGTGPSTHPAMAVRPVPAAGRHLVAVAGPGPPRWSP